MAFSCKCPGCGAVLQFDSSKQALSCTHCGNEFSVDEVDKEYSKGKSEQTADFNLFKCQSCGAELVTDEHTAATFCNFCGNSTLIQERLTGEKTPDYLIPFKKNKNEAIEAFKKWTKRGMLTPSEFTNATTIEKISGIYVPFWMYDYTSRVKMNASGVKVRHSSDAKNYYTHKDHFKIYRNMQASYDNIPVDASRKMPDDIMDKLEPFDYGETTDFQMPYLSGFLAEKYNFTAKEMEDRVLKRVNQYILDMAKDSIKGYSSLVINDNYVDSIEDNVRYALLPVWMLNYRYKNKNYMFAMNGQTGKVVGDLPISKTKVFLWFAGLSVLFSIIFILMGGVF